MLKYKLINLNITAWLVVLIAVAVISCQKTKTEIVVTKPAPKAFSNIVILGNSITLIPPMGGEWPYNWGMAASAADSDYVHRLTAKFKALNANSKVTIQNINAYEGDFENFDLDGHFKTLNDSKPDLLIIRIGENLNQVPFNEVAFAKSYANLINYFKRDNSNLQILSVGPLWPRPDLERIMSITPYQTLSQFCFDPSNYAYGKFIDPGIQAHPGDKGMRVIADSIWSGVQRLKHI